MSGLEETSEHRDAADEPDGAANNKPIDDTNITTSPQTTPEELCSAGKYNLIEFIEEVLILQNGIDRAARLLDSRRDIGSLHIEEPRQCHARNRQPENRGLDRMQRHRRRSVEFMGQFLQNRMRFGVDIDSLLKEPPNSIGSTAIYPITTDGIASKTRGRVTTQGVSCGF